MWNGLRMWMRPAAFPHDEGTAGDPGKNRYRFPAAEEQNMSLWRSIDGVVEVEITAAEPENALTEIIRSGIEIRSVCRDKDLVCAFSVRRLDDCKLAALCKKRG